MSHLNVEIKAKINDPIRWDNLSCSLINAPGKWVQVGEDHQIDTYYETAHGRLKVREGKIEKYLIHYIRENQEGPKKSDVTLVKLYGQQCAEMNAMLVKLGMRPTVVVDKTRYIYFVDNVKFHFDEVKDLGYFVEIEAIDKDGTLGLEHIQKQCAYYVEYLGIQPEELVACSYSDLLVNNG